MKSLTRRDVLRRGSAGVAAVTALAACAPTPAASLVAVTTPATGGEPHGESHAVSTATPIAEVMQSPPAPVDDMDAMHEEGIKYFVENAGKDPLFWENRLAYTLDGDVKVFELTCTELQWDTGGGNMMSAMAYNGVVPGPEIRVTEGDRVRVHVTNEMSQSTSVHWHGVNTPNSMDGVPFITQPPIKTGETFTYEFVAKPAGSHMYHSHHNAAEQVTKGLMGAFIVEPKDRSKEPQVDAEYVFILNDAGVGLTINGRGFPHTQPIPAKLGDTIRVRYMNEGLMVHPMHLHGMAQLVITKDGYPVPQPYLCDTLNVAPGERYDVIVTCDNPGVWAFHCHILSHAESKHGMFGMVTALIVEEA